LNAFDELSRRDFLDYSLRLGAAGLAASCTAASTMASAAGDRWQIGCYTRPWAKYDYRVALDAIAEAGFKHAGLMTAKSKNNLVISVATTLEEAEQAGREARKRGLKIPSVYGGGIPVNKSLEAGIEGLRKLIDNCAACGAGNLLMGGIGNEKLYDTYYKAIAECCDYAAEKGIGISVKPHGGLNATGPQCRKTIEMVNHKNFRIWYDPGNIYYYSDGKRDPVTDSATVDGLVVGMCVKDYKHPKKVDLTPGTGMVDFPAVMARLKKGGFTGGPLVVECLEPGNLEQTLAEAKKVRLFLEELTGQKSSSASGSSGRAAQLRAGLAVADITPPSGYRMSGYFSERLSTGTSNPLHTKAIVFRQGDNDAIGALVNFTLHLDTVGGTKYAADYPYYIEQSLREKYGDNFVLLFGNGTCGDINHFDVTKKERLQTDYIGRTLAETVDAKTESLKTVAEPLLDVRSGIVDAPLQQFGPDDVVWACENIKKVGTGELSFIKQVEAYKILARQMRRGWTIPLEVQVFRLSWDVAVVGLPGEVFVDLGLAIKRASPFATTLVIELCQDAPGYIPTKKAFAEGSYETVNSRIAPGGGEMMAEAAIRLLKKLGPVAI